MNGRWTSIAPIRLAVAALALALAVLWPTITSGGATPSPTLGPSYVAPIYPPFPAQLPDATQVTAQGHGLWDDVVSGARTVWDRLTDRSSS